MDKRLRKGDPLWGHPLKADAGPCGTAPRVGRWGNDFVIVKSVSTGVKKSFNYLIFDKQNLKILLPSEAQN